MNVGYEELYHALEESVKLQSHYAQLLNMYHGGTRLLFKDAQEWLLRLRQLDNRKDKKGKQR